MKYVLSIFFSLLSFAARAESDGVSIHFPEPTDIKDIIKAVSLWTGKQVLMDQNVSGKIEIISPKKVSPDEAYQIFITALNALKLTTVESGKLIKIVRKQEAMRLSNPVMGENDRLKSVDTFITKVFHPRHVQLSEVKKLLVKVLDPNAILELPQSGVFVISDTAANIARAETLIQSLDSPNLKEELQAIRIHYSTPTQVKAYLDAIAQEDASFSKQTGSVAGSTMPKAKLMADDAKNLLYVFALPAAISTIKRRVQSLDIEDTDHHGYGLKLRPLAFSDAKKMAGMLTSMRLNEDKTSTDIKIIPEETSNSLLISAPPDAFSSINRILRSFDKARPQVFVEVDIVEILAGHGFESMGSFLAGIGKESQTKSVFAWQASEVGPLVIAENNESSKNNATTFASSVAPIYARDLTISLLPTKSVDVQGFGKMTPAALLHLLKADSYTRLISSPYLLTSAGEETSFTVGETLFFQTAEVNAMGVPVSKTSKENVDLTVNLKPNISSEGRLTMEIKIENKAIASLTKGGLPSLSLRKTKQTLTLQNAQTALLSGFERSFQTKSVQKIPLLGDLPIIGFPFRREVNRLDTGHIYFFVTPHVILSDEDLRAVYERKIEAIGVSSELAALKKTISQEIDNKPSANGDYLP